MKYLSFCFSLLLCLILSNIHSQTITSTEAVEYDPIGNRFLITNGTSILQQASGSNELTFFSDGDADYGMEVLGNTLVTISGNSTQSIKGFNLAMETEIFSFEIENSGFLNGMASDPSSNKVWVTDFSDEYIYEINIENPDSPTINLVVVATGCTPNGVTHDAENNRLVYVCWNGGDIKSVDLDSYSVSTLVNTNLNNMDGIDMDGNGNFYVSSWSPTRISKFNSGFSTEETITTTGLSNPADISYAIEIDSLAIANSGNNTITYINFGVVDGIEVLENISGMKVYPNPVSQQAGKTNNLSLSFHLKSPSDCTIEITDENGKVVYRENIGNIDTGEQNISLSSLSLNSGLYFCNVQLFTGDKVVKFVVE